MKIESHIGKIMIIIILSGMFMMYCGISGLNKIVDNSGGWGGVVIVVGKEFKDISAEIDAYKPNGDAHE